MLLLSFFFLVEVLESLFMSADIITILAVKQSYEQNNPEVSVLFELE